jgi:hypothetical protein
MEKERGGSALPAAEHITLAAKWSLVKSNVD